MSLDAVDQNSFVSQMFRRSKRSEDWISKDPKYISWVESNKSDLIWLTAKAGYGKTTLASHMVQNIQANQSPQSSASQTNNAKPAVLFFFFHKSNLEAEGKTIDALRTLVCQLARQFPEVFSIVLERYELLSSRGNFEWSWENLSSMVDDILEHIPHKIIRLHYSRCTGRM